MSRRTGSAPRAGNLSVCGSGMRLWLWRMRGLCRILRILPVLPKASHFSRRGLSLFFRLLIGICHITLIHRQSPCISRMTESTPVSFISFMA